VIALNDPTKIVFKAVADTAQSDALPVEVIWDGNWDSNAAIMNRHIKVRVVE
jgi:hypothetical protein